jgi:tRNA(Leu) C34 or U34 (ribose-2'-O)-methylase TrmL
MRAEKSKMMLKNNRLMNLAEMAEVAVFTASRQGEWDDWNYR